MKLSWTENIFTYWVIFVICCHYVVICLVGSLREFWVRKGDFELIWKILRLKLALEIVLFCINIYIDLKSFSNSGLSVIRISMRFVFCIINSYWGTGQRSICSWSASKNSKLIYFYVFQTNLWYTYIESFFWKVFGYRTCSYHTPAYFANSKSVKFGTSAHFWPYITFCAWVTRKNDQNFNRFILEKFLWWISKTEW